MIQMPKSGKAHPLEYFFRIGIPIALIWGAIQLYNAVAPSLILAIKNTWVLLAIGTPLVLLGLYIGTNPQLIWMSLKTLSRKITSLIIKMDPLSFMDRYVDILGKKKVNLDGARTTLEGKKTKLGRRLGELQANIQENIKLANAAKKQGQDGLVSTYGSKIGTDEQTIRIFQPIFQRMERNLVFLNDLSENWGWSIEKLKYTIARKREEYEMIKETAKACREAEEFARVTEAKELYEISVKELEESVTQKIAFIDQFEKDSKALISGLKVEKQAMQDEGMSILEKYSKDGKLTLPDYSNFSKSAIVDVQHEVVSTKYNL